MSSLPLNAVDSAFSNASAKRRQILNEAFAAGFPASPERSLDEKKSRHFETYYRFRASVGCASSVAPGGATPTGDAFERHC